VSRLDDIIDAHAGPVLPALEDGFRHFNDGDWAAWCGCETEHPQVYESEEIVVVLDGRTVNATTVTDGEELLLFVKDFESEAVARAIARSLRFLPAPTEEAVEQFLGEAVGEL